MLKKSYNLTRTYFHQLYQSVADSEGKVSGQQGGPVLSSSGLPKDQLKEIWMMVAKTNPQYLVKNEFFLALRMIAYFQNNIIPTKEIILRNAIVPLPNLNTNAQPQVDESIFAISSAEAEKFSSLFDKNKDSSNAISNGKLKEMMSGNRIEPSIYLPALNCLKFTGSRTEFIALIKMVNILIARPDINLTKLPGPIVEFINSRTVNDSQESNRPSITRESVSSSVQQNNNVPMKVFHNPTVISSSNELSNLAKIFGDSLEKLMSVASSLHLANDKQKQQVEIEKSALSEVLSHVGKINQNISILQDENKRLQQSLVETQDRINRSAPTAKELSTSIKALSDEKNELLSYLLIRSTNVS